MYIEVFYRIAAPVNFDTTIKSFSVKYHKQVVKIFIAIEISLGINLLKSISKAVIFQITSEAQQKR